MDRLFFSILSEDVKQAASFYIDLLDMHVHFDSDWFVILKPSPNSPIEMGIIDKHHEIAPGDAVAERPSGVLPTFVVDDVEVIFTKAKAMGATIIEPPADMFYGQRRLLLRDRDAMVIDISSPTARPPG